MYTIVQLLESLWSNINDKDIIKCFVDKTFRLLVHGCCRGCHPTVGGPQKKLISTKGEKINEYKS